jgi:hypothetical protein
MNEEKENKMLLKVFLLGSVLIYLPGLLIGLISPCESAHTLMTFYLALGLPWSLAFTDLFEGLLKNIPSLTNSEGFCLGPIDNLAYSVSIFINLLLVLIFIKVLRMIFVKKVKFRNYNSKHGSL